MNRDGQPILTYSDIVNSDGTAKVDLSGCSLMIFLACESAAMLENAEENQSICKAAVLAGAEYAIGFTEEIVAKDANLWVEVFFRHYAEGESVQDCVEAADSYKVGEESPYVNLQAIQSSTIFH